MKEVYVEFVDREVVVYLPGTTKVATTKPSLEEALVFERAEWPDLEIRVTCSQDAAV